jgi:tetratricopeptide (TPR) repeat protein
MKDAKKNHAMISAAVLTIVATAAVACSSSPRTAIAPSPTATPTATGGSSAGAGGSSAGAGGTNSSTASSQVTSLFQSGLAQMKTKKWSAATTSFQNVLAISPGDVYANYDLGVIAQSTGHPDAAISYYNKALAANAAYQPAMYNEAILLESSHPQQAIALYENVVKIDPKAATAYLRLAVVQAEQGDSADAKANDAKAVSIDPAFSKYKLPAKN